MLFRSASGGFKAQLQVGQGGWIGFPDGSQVKVEAIHGVVGPMGMMTSYSAELRTPEGQLREVRPNQPLFFEKYGIYLKDVALDPAPMALFEVHREPGAPLALAGALVFTVGNLMLLGVRRGR